MDFSTPDASGEEYVNSASDLTSVLVHVQELMSDCSLSVYDEDLSGQDKENRCEIKSLTASNEKILGKSATFPCSRQPGDEAYDGLGSVESSKPAWARSVSLPTSLKSAMKGSRERNGASDEKTLTVTWAPDVYDPPVTSVSHAVKGYTQQRSRSSKKNNKNKHKGKSSRAEKEKKQYRKHSDPRPKSTQESKTQLFHQDMEFLESNCGSSFLRSSAGTVHLALTEAT